MYIVHNYVTGHIEAGSSGFGAGHVCRPMDTYKDFWYSIVCYVYVDSMFVFGGGSANLWWAGVPS